MIRTLAHRIRKFFNRELTTIEKFGIQETGRSYLSRVDMGATVCALHAKDIVIDEWNNTVTFKHSGTVYTMPMLRYKEVKNANGVAMRARVALSFVWNGKTYKNIETSLADRSKMRFEVLIGRNLIRELDLPVRLSNDEQLG